VLGMALGCWCGVLGLELGGAKNWGVLRVGIDLGNRGGLGKLGRIGVRVGSAWARQLELDLRDGDGDGDGVRWD
jgi:hypothetical protein